MNIESIREDISNPKKMYTKKEIRDLMKQLLSIMSDIDDETRSYTSGDLSDASNGRPDFNQASDSSINASQHLARLCNKRKEMEGYYATLESLFEKQRNFNKALCLSNIRALLKSSSDIKIGQIEAEAGLRMGYMSRLEKEDNTTEPSIEFIVTAAKMLNVSLDSLLYIDFSDLTPTERYLLDFFEKLKNDTIKENLEWIAESAQVLKHLHFYDDSFMHPLFSYTEEDDGDKIIATFYSDSFGECTTIAGDCFKTTLHSDAILYLMNVRSCNSVKETAIELWIYIPEQEENQIILTTRSESSLSSMIGDLYNQVSERLRHPQIKRNAVEAINLYMGNEPCITDDNLPFKF